MEIAELARVRGPGDAKAVRLKVTLELGRQRMVRRYGAEPAPLP